MKKAISIIVLFFFFSLSNVIGKINIEDHVQKNTVRIIYIYGYSDILGNRVDRVAICTGVMLNPQKILTCFHICEGKPSGYFIAHILINKKKVVRTIYPTIIAWDRTNDLLLLSLPEPIPGRGVQLAERVIFGEKIYFRGYSTLPLPDVRIGFATFTSKKGIYLRPVFYGDSGGPVFNKKGELVGIICLLYEINSVPLLDGHAVHLDKIRAFLFRK